MFLWLLPETNHDITSQGCFLAHTVLSVASEHFQQSQHFLVLQVCRLTQLVEAASSSSTTTTQLSARLGSLRNTLATKVPPRVLLPTTSKCYSNMIPNKKVGNVSVVTVPLLIL